MTAKYYLWGDGYSCWTVDLWHGREHFEKQKEFRLPPRKANAKPLDADGKREQQVAYLECKLKAIRYVKKLITTDNIPVAGGPFWTLTVE